MELLLLGTLELHADDGSVLRPTGHTGHLLAAFAHSQGRRLSVERIGWCLWGEDQPASARASIQVYVAKIRKIIASSSSTRVDLVETLPNGYRFDHSGLVLDTARFRTLVADAQRLPEPHQTRLITEALELWRGRPYAPWTDDDWFRGDADSLDELRLALEEDLVDAELALGRHAEQVGNLRSLVDAAPLRERRWCQLMLALYRCGRRADALRTYRQLHTRLVEELGIGPGPEARLLEESILFDDPTLFRSGAVLPAVTPPIPLPDPGTSLIGRQGELVEVAALLARYPLVTLTGPGGVGKTRLAIEVARAADPERITPQVFVDVGEITDPDQVLPAVMGALGCPVSEPGERTTMVDRIEASLPETETLLVLDGCEHLLESVAEVVHHLHASWPTVHILATSSEPLDIAYEAVYPVRPLAVPDPSATMEQVAQVESVRLFSDRAQQRSRGFELTNSNRAAITQICRTLEGIPLALELAATALGSSTPDQLAQELQHSLAPLSRGRRGTSARHQTIAATIDWSYQRLDENLRRLLRRVSVFRGGWTIDSAVVVTDLEDAGVDAIREGLRRLVNRSLIEFPLDQAGPRYRLLEPVRHIARDLCGDAGELDDIRRRHAEHFQSSATKAMQAQTGADQARWYLYFDAERANYRAAIDWGIEGEDCAYLAEMIAAISRFWFTRDSDSDLAVLMQRSVDLCTLASPKSVSPLLLYGAQMAVAHGNGELATERLSRFADSHPIDEGSEAQLYWQVRGNLSGFVHGNPIAALDAFSTAVRIGEMSHSTRLLGALSLLGYMKARTLDTLGARDTIRRMSEWEQQSPPQHRIATDQILGMIALLGDAPDEATARFRRSLDAIQGLGRVSAIPRASIHLGWALLEQNDVTETALLAETTLQTVQQPRGWQRSGLLSLLGACSLRSGNPEAALAQYGSSVEASRHGPTNDMLVLGLSGLAASLNAIGRQQDALTALLAAQAIQTYYSIVVPPAEASRADSLREVLVDALGPARYSELESDVADAGIVATMSALRSLAP